MFTTNEQEVLYLINNLRADNHVPTRAEIEQVVDAQSLQSLESRGDVCFDENGVLTYAPYPRR